MKHLLIAGGGTGGHIAPAIAIGNVAQNYFSVSYAATPRPVDKRMYSSVSNTVHVMNPPRIDKGLKILVPFMAIFSFFKAVQLLKRNKVDLVLGTGGYSSFFAILAARFLGKPTAIFDSNALPGRSNRIASKFCKLAFIAFSEAEEKLKCSVVLSGTPVLDKIQNAIAEKERFLDKKAKILFLGGSQGARGINDIALAMGNDISVLVQSGATDYERVSKMAFTFNDFKVEAFLDNLIPWYSVASLVVARSGGQTIAELAAIGIPAVFIPYPFAAENHQTLNAKAICNTGGALWFSQKKTKPEDLKERILNLVRDKERLFNMGKAMKENFKEDAAKKIVYHLKRLIS